MSTPIALAYYILVPFATIAVLHWITSYRNFKRRSNGHPFPPGPKPKPIVGNITEILTKRPWHKFTQLQKEFGDIIYLEALGNKIVILNSIEVAQELLERRPHIYSDRPSFTMIGELIGLDNSLPMLPYGTAFKKQRKLCHSGLSSTAVKKYHSIQEDAIALYLLTLVERPQDFISELRLAAGRIVMSVTYGFPVSTPDHSYLDEAEATMEMIEKGTVIGAYLVDIFPALKYLPSWLPFNTIHETAAAGRELLFNMVDHPYQHVKRGVAEGNATPSFTFECLRPFEADIKSLEKEIEDSIRWAAGSMYGAGGESTFATILTFIYAMALYPEVQDNIQMEIDRVIPNDCLPKLEDIHRLPYVNATIKETMRWKPALPMSIARTTSQDDYYRGYFIPSGTIVLPNVWAMSRDHYSGIPSEEFAPERFLKAINKNTGNSGPVNPADYSFGFGRRVCPGKYLGENNIFLLVTYLMSTMKISRKRDSKGDYVPLDLQYTPGLVSFPEPFEVKFTPRNMERLTHVKSKDSNVL